MSAWDRLIYLAAIVGAAAIGAWCIYQDLLRYWRGK